MEQAPSNSQQEHWVATPLILDLKLGRASLKPLSPFFKLVSTPDGFQLPIGSFLIVDQMNSSPESLSSDYLIRIKLDSTDVISFTMSEPLNRASAICTFINMAVNHCKSKILATLNGKSLRFIAEAHSKSAEEQMMYWWNLALE